MNTLACLALIVYMEARSEPVLAQTLVAQVVINRAKAEETTICNSMKRPRSYSFYWDGKPNLVKEKEVYDEVLKLSNRVLKQNNLENRLYFNECSLGKRFKTKYKVQRTGKLCFY